MDGADSESKEEDLSDESDSQESDLEEDKDVIKIDVTQNIKEMKSK